MRGQACGVCRIILKATQVANDGHRPGRSTVGVEPEFDGPRTGGGTGVVICQVAVFAFVDGEPPAHITNLATSSLYFLATVDNAFGNAFALVAVEPETHATEGIGVVKNVRVFGVEHSAAAVFGRAVERPLESGVVEVPDADPLG